MSNRPVSPQSNTAHTTQSSGWMTRRLILVMGKGGVGKTAVAMGAAHKLAQTGARVYLAHIDHSAVESSPAEKITPYLTQQTLAADTCFQEYISLKLKVGALAKILLKNKFIQYLQKASPGISEIVLIGKVWHELNNYDHVVVDMPGTGHALAMLHAPFNFSKLFLAGPIYNDALSMSKTLASAQTTAHVCVSLPEEMPLQESKELAQSLQKLIPQNKPWLIFNRTNSLDTNLAREIVTHTNILKQLAPHNPLAAAALYTQNKSQTQENSIKNFTALHLFEPDPLKIIDYGVLTNEALLTEAFK